MANFRITIDEAIQESLSKEQIVELAESVHAFVEAGILDCEDQGEILVDQEFLLELTKGIERLRKAVKEYGRDPDGFAKYPF